MRWLQVPFLILLLFSSHVQAQELIQADPPGLRIPNQGRPAHAVENLVLTLDEGSPIVTFNHVALDKKCAGHSASQGPYFNLTLLDGNKSVIFTVTNLLAIMEPDGGTRVQETIQLNGKVPHAIVRNTKFVGGFMPNPGHCGR